MARVLTIGDTHCPFVHPKYWEFLERIRDEYHCDTVVHIGDVVDNHAASFHTSELDAMGMDAESEAAHKQLQELYGLFPDVKVCLGNHDRIPERKAKESVIPRRWLKSYADAMGSPPGWKWDSNWEIDGVRYTHGTTSGKTAHVVLAERSRQSCVMGHTHSFGGVQYLASEHDLVFGMNVGCGIHCSAFAFRYGRDFVHRPTLGCGVVIDGFQAMFIPMILSGKRLRRPRVSVPKWRKKGR